MFEKYRGKLDIIHTGGLKKNDIFIPNYLNSARNTVSLWKSALFQNWTKIYI